MALLRRRQGREVSLKINSLVTKTQKCLTEHGSRCGQKQTAALSYGVQLLWCLHGPSCSVCSAVSRSGVCRDGAHTGLFIFNIEGPGSIWSIEYRTKVAVTGLELCGCYQERRHGEGSQHIPSLIQGEFFIIASRTPPPHWVSISLRDYRASF